MLYVRIQGTALIIVYCHVASLWNIILVQIWWRWKFQIISDGSCMAKHLSWNSAHREFGLILQHSSVNECQCLCRLSFNLTCLQNVSVKLGYNLLGHLLCYCMHKLCTVISDTIINKFTVSLVIWMSYLWKINFNVSSWERLFSCHSRLCDQNNKCIYWSRRTYKLF